MLNNLILFIVNNLVIVNVEIVGINIINILFIIFGIDRGNIVLKNICMGLVFKFCVVFI